MNLARLNHILIPTTAEGRDRWRRSLVGRLLRPGWAVYGALSEEGRALSILVLFVGAASVDVARTQVHVLWAALVGLLGAALVIRRWFDLDGVRLVARVPRRVAAGEPLAIDLALCNDSARARHNVRVRGPFLPWDGSYRGRRSAVAELRAGQVARLEATAVFVQRGWHHLDAFTACQLAPLGLSLGPHIDSEQCRFLVVPRLVAVARLTLPDGGGGRAGEVPRASIGGYTSDLAGVRPYRVGDPIRDLHAKTWARTGIPHVREYEQILQRRVMVVLSPEPSADEALFEAAVSLAAGVVSHLYHRDAIVDLVTVDGGPRLTTVGKGVAPFEHALDVLAVLGPRPIEGEALRDLLAARRSATSSVVVVTSSRREPGPPLDLAGLPSRTLRVARGGAGRPRETVIAPERLREREALVL